MDNELRQLYSKADEYSARIRKARPLSKKELESLNKYFRVGLTYTSNAIEGNSLTETETKILLEDGLTVGGKTIRETYEATGHADAYDYMTSLAVSDDYIVSDYDIKKLHSLFYSRIDAEHAGVYRDIQVFISGTDYLPPAPEMIQANMSRFVDEINGIRSEVHPIEWAARIHKGIVDIHPFEDGNGRTARLMMNLALIQKGYGIAIIPPVLRREYIDSLIAAQREYNPDDKPFIRLIAQCVIETQKDYCRMFRIATG